MLVICRRSELLQRTSGQGAMALLRWTSSRPRVALPIAPSSCRRGRAMARARPSCRVDPADVTALLADCERHGVFGRAVQGRRGIAQPADGSARPRAGRRPRRAGASPARPRTTRRCDGRRWPTARCGRDYWGRNLRQPVLFGPAVEQMLGEGIDAIVEIGPHPTLAPDVAEVGSGSAPPLTLVARCAATNPNAPSLLDFARRTLGKRAPGDWAALFPTGLVSRVALPHYPWQRERHWPDAAMSVQTDPNRRRVRLDDPARAGSTSRRGNAGACRPRPRRGTGCRANSAFDAEELIDALATAGSTAEHVRSRDGRSAGSVPASQEARGISGSSSLPSPRLEPAFGAVSLLRDLQQPAASGRISRPRVWWLTRGAHLPQTSPVRSTPPSMPRLGCRASHRHRAS